MLSASENNFKTPRKRFLCSSVENGYASHQCVMPSKACMSVCQFVLKTKHGQSSSLCLKTIYGRFDLFVP
jgi:hypothetical protein